jgi:16S rRNA (cytidine1402-2'-O)-methyltransferase
MNLEPALYLIPVPLGKTETNTSIPPGVLDIIRSLTHFAVESMPNTLRFMQWVGETKPMHECTFHELNKRTPPEEIMAIMNILKSGKSLGIMTDAGCPAIADPGADLAKLAQENGIRVIPLVGPNSMTLALMASGLGGQSYAFAGYLPIQEKERKQTILALQESSLVLNRTELFMEAPHRNLNLVESLKKSLNPNTRLCIACNITLPSEWIKTKRISEWKPTDYEHIQKQPCVFLIKAG